jgi:hypothetical protein
MITGEISENLNNLIEQKYIQETLFKEATEKLGFTYKEKELWD